MGAVLLEREAERDAIAGVVERSGAGRGDVLVISGPPGIGKTVLLEKAVDLAEGSRCRVLRARATSLELSYAFGVVRQVFAPLWSEAADAPSRGVVAMAMAAVGPDANPELTLSADVGVVRGLYQLLARAADRHPLLVVVDDLHWADPASHHVLGYLARRLRTLPVGLIASARNTAEMLPDVDHRVVRPAGLSPAAVARLTEQVLGVSPDPGFLDALVGTTGGNPMLVVQVLEACARAGTAPVEDQVEAISSLGGEAVGRIVRGQLATASAESRRMAEAAAVLGAGAGIGLVARLAELSDEAAGEAASELVALGLFSSRSPTEFRHDMLREAVQSLTGQAALEVGHLRAAELLGKLDHPAEAVAAHLLRVAPRGDGPTVDRLERAAGEAIVRRDSRAAITYLRRALAEPPPNDRRPGILVKLAQAESLADHTAAVGHLREAEHTLGPGRARAEVTSMLAGLLTSERPAEAMEVGMRCLADADASAPEMASIVLAQIALARVMTEPRAELPAAIEGRLDKATAEPSTGGAMLSAIRGFESAMANERREVVSSLVGPAIRREGFATTLVTGANFTFGLIALGAYDLDDARDLSRGFVDAVEVTGSVATLIAASLHAAEQHWADGDLTRAAGQAEQGLAAARDYGLRGAGIGYLSAVLSQVERERGNLDRAAQVLEVARVRDGGATGGVISIAGIDGAAAALRERGEARQALAGWMELGSRYQAVGGVSPVLVPWRSRAARLLARIGEPARGAGLAREEVVLARACGARRALARALRAAGAVDPGPDGSRALEEAYESVRATPYRLEWARSALSLGRRLAATGSLAPGLSLLREATELAQGCGAALVAERATAALAEVGVRPGGTLTPREHEIAVLAAEGLPSRVIAERLFLNVRTVETHLGRVFRKLNINRRSHLREALGHHRS